MKSTTLYYSDIALGGTSDKEYTVTLLPKGDGFVVNYAHGRRGETQTVGTKTDRPVSEAEAETIYADVVRDKKKKGYDTTGPARPAPASIEDDGSRTPFPIESLSDISRTENEALIRDNRYYLQMKLDGHRRQIRKNADGLFGYNKKGGPASIPREVALALNELPFKSFFIDGELIGDAFVAFDIFTANGVNITKLPYSDRFATLEKAFPRRGVRAIALVPTWKTTGQKQFGLAALYSQRSEGAVWKLITAPYRAGANGQHRRFKFVKSCTCKVIRLGDQGHNSATIALLDGQTWKEVGKVSLNGKDPRVQVGSLIEVLFLYATEGRRLYQPRLKEIRTDVSESECTFKQLAQSYKEGVNVAA